jgi:hypothetical protein
LIIGANSAVDTVPARAAHLNMSTTLRSTYRRLHRARQKAGLASRHHLSRRGFGECLGGGVADFEHQATRAGPVRAVGHAYRAAGVLACVELASQWIGEFAFEQETSSK